MSSALSLAATDAARGQPLFSEKPITTTDGNPVQTMAVDMDRDGDDDVLARFAFSAIAWYENTGRGPFVRREIGITSDAVFAADLDGDGDTDVVSAASIPAEILWYENDGAQNFTARTIAGGDADSVFVEDLDGDGAPDVLASIPGDGRLVWFENDGMPDPTFSLRTIATTAVDEDHVFAADMDGDGHTDLVLAEDANILWYRNDGNADPGFTRRTIGAAPSTATALVVDDLDGDGHADVVVSTRFGSETVGWFRNDGAQTFDFRTITTSANDPESVYAADLDGDGDTDVLSASYSDNKVAWYENDGLADPGFMLRTITTDALGAFSVATGDRDGDGDTDVLAASFSDSTLAWYDNDARQPFAPFAAGNSIITAADGARWISAADIDGDGDDDVVLAAQNAGLVAWYENDNQSFSLVTIAAASAPAAVHTADIDGDGDPDVLVADPGSGSVNWYRNDDPGFTPFAITAAAAGAASVFTADTDGDGDLDVLVGAGDNVTLHRNNSLVFAPYAIDAVATSVQEVSAADVDRDGDPDVLAAYQGAIAWYSNQGEQIFTKLVIATTVQTGKGVFATDLDGDGDVDVLSASLLDHKVAWYENDGSQNFTSHTIATDVIFAFGVTADDVDLDGDMDVLATGGSRVRLFENDGGTRFRDRSLATDRENPHVVLSTDLDGDGDRDVLAVDFNLQVVDWYENLAIHRSGAFESARLIATNADRPFAVFAADVDGDGDLDVLSASRNDDKVAWYENDGAEGFTLRTIVTGIGLPFTVAAADLDGDGDTDVFSASTNANAPVAWYENSGTADPTFTLLTISTNVQDARSIIAGDVDSDGDTDVLLASAFGSNRVAWFENDGLDDPTFTLRTIATNFGYASSVFAADVDGDGDLDVLSSADRDNVIAWFENNGAADPGFTQRVIATNADGATSVFAADLDGDGDIDVLSSSRRDDKIAWYENDGMQGFTLHTITTDAGGARQVFADDVDNDGDVDAISVSAYGDKAEWYENDGNQNFTVRPIAADPGAPYDILAVDLDRDGDTDALTASLYDDKIAWYENCGGQFLFAGQDAAPAMPFAGSTIELLSLDFVHNGRTGDSSAELDSIALQFTDVNGNPLNSAQANALVSELRVYLDDGGGTFDPGSDTLLATVADLELTPRAFVQAIQTVPITDGDVVVAGPDGTARLFVVADLSPDADLQVPSSFRVGLNAIPLPRPQGQDAASGSVLTLECAMNAQSAVVTPQPAPTVSLSVDSNSGTEADMTAITVTATAGGAVSGAQTVELAVTGTGVTAGDYMLSATQITIPDGMTTGSVTFTVQDDDLLEGSETATLTIGNPSAGIRLGAITSQDIDISDNDFASVQINCFSGQEDAGTLAVDVILRGAVQDPFNVDYGTSDGTAQADDDYIATSGTLGFAGTDFETQSFTVPLVDDAVLEPTESFQTSLSNLSNPNVMFTENISTDTCSILDDDSASVSIDDVTVSEADGMAMFTATLAGDVQDPFSVDYATADDTALEGSDYAATTGSLSFTGTNGETRTFAVPVIDDDVAENAEQFLATLDNPTGGVTIADGQGVGTIFDDDAAGLSIADVTVNEGDGLATFQVALSGAVAGGTTVFYATSDDTATAGSDYTASSDQLTFAGNDGEIQTFTVPITDDADIENTEQFFVTLSEATNGATIADGQAVGIIEDNDATTSPPSIQAASFQIPDTAQNSDVVGQVSVSDPDNDIPSTGAFAIIDGDPGGAFAILDDGTIVVNDATALVPGTQRITVEVTDAVGLSDSALVEIGIGDLIARLGFEGD